MEQGGESLEQFADVAGMSASEFQQAFKEDAAQALVSFVEGLGTMDERGKSAIATLADMEITEIRQRDALLRLAGAGYVLSESLWIASDAWAENTALTKEAEQRYETLENRLQILKNNVADLGITFYDSLRDPLKNTVDEGIVYVDRLSAAFGSGGLQGAVSAAGGIFADLAADAASHAPDMVNAAVQFIQSFAAGLYANRGQIISAAGNIAVALGEGLADLLPSSVSIPVKEAVKEIGESFENGGLRESISTVTSLFKKFNTVAGNVAKVTLPPLAKAVDLVSGNLETFVPLATSAFAAFKAHKQITSTTSVLSKAAKAWKTAEKAVDAYCAVQLLAMESGTKCTAALTIGQAAVGLVTGKITLATAAQAAWNKVMSANPIGLAVTAVAALAAAIGVSALMTDKASSSTAKLTEKQKESIDASKEAIKAIEEEAEARQKNINASTAEIDNAEVLWGELQKCVDANGKVKEGYEARAQYITGELSSALGTEISMTDGVIQNYVDLENSIYDVIAAKKAEALLNAMEDDYLEATRTQAEKIRDLAVATEEVNSRKERQAELEAELKELAKSTDYGDSRRYAELSKELDTLNGELEVHEENLKEASTAMKDNQDIISDYDTILEAAMSKDAGIINNAIAEIQSGIDTTLEAGSKAALQQAEEVGTTLLAVLQAQADGMEGLKQETVDSTAESMGIAVNTISTSADSMKAFLESVGSDGAERMLTAMKNAELSGNLSAEAKSGMEAMIAAMESMDSEFYATGSDSINQYAGGMSSQEDNVSASAKGLAESADDSASSITGYDAGVNFGTGYSLGIQSAVAGAVASAASLAAQSLTAAKREIQSNSPAKKTIKLGHDYGEGYEIGISDEEAAVEKASEGLSEAALGSLDTDFMIDQLKQIDIAGVMDQIYSAMDDVNLRIADRVTARREAADRSELVKDDRVLRLSDDDIERLAKKIGSATARDISKQKNNTPIFIGTERVDRPLPKGAVPRL